MKLGFQVETLSTATKRVKVPQLPHSFKSNQFYLATVKYHRTQKALSRKQNEVKDVTTGVSRFNQKYQKVPKRLYLE